MWDNTPLTCAAYYGHEDVALTLLELGADPTAENEHGCTALLFAAVESMPRLLRALLAIKDVARSLAAGKRAVVYNGTTDETAERTPLLAAAESGFVEGVQLLLAHGALLADARAGAGSPLALAARRGHAHVCSLLLTASASVAPTLQPARAGAPDAPPALRVAVSHGHMEAALVILGFAPSAAVADPGLVPLSATRGLLPLCRALIDAGASVDTPGDDGLTALHIAVRRDDAAMTRLLIALGASLHVTDAHGRTPRQLAQLSGHEALEEELARLEGDRPNDALRAASGDDAAGRAAVSAPAAEAVHLS